MKAETACLDILEAVARITMMARTCDMESEPFAFSTTVTL